MNQAATAGKLTSWVTLSNKRLTLLPFSAGLLIPFGFAPFHTPGLTFLGMAVLFGLLRKATPKQAFVIGLVFALGYLGLGVSWVYVSIHEYGHLNEVTSALVTLLFLMYLALYPALISELFVFLARKRSLLFSCFLFSALWSLGEWLRANCFLGGFPWLLFGFGQMDTPIKFLLPLFGIYGAGFVVCLAATLLSGSVAQDNKLKYLYIMAFIVLILSPSIFKNTAWTVVSDKPIPVGVVQANLSMRDKWDESLFWELLQKYKENVELLVGKNQLIVLPESAIPLPESYLSEYLDEIHNQAKQIGSAVLLGIPQPAVSDDTQFYNTMASLGEARGSYLKQHLVPFGEFIPNSFHWFFNWFSLPKSNMKPGEKKQSLIEVLNHPIATLICYELAYPELLREQLPAAEWIVSISDDGWFGHSFAMYQHLQMAQALSLQMGRYQVVANNDGLSSVINDKGDITASLPAFSSGRLEANLYPATGASPWVKWGDTPILILILSIILLAIILRIRR